MEAARALAPPADAASYDPAGPPDYVRQAVRGILLAAPAFQALDPDRRRALASAMVRVCTVAAALIHEEL